MTTSEKSPARDPKAGGVGKASLRFQHVVSKRLDFVALTSCVQCGRPLVVEHGALAPTFRVGTEFIGVCCTDCLTDDSRVTLARLRHADRGPHRGRTVRTLEAHRQRLRDLSSAGDHP